VGFFRFERFERFFLRFERFEQLLRVQTLKGALEKCVAGLKKGVTVHREPKRARTVACVGLGQKNPKKSVSLLPPEDSRNAHH